MGRARGCTYEGEAQSGRNGPLRAGNGKSHERAIIGWMETHKERLLREAAEAADRADRREEERAFRIECEAAIRQVWIDLITSAAAVGFMERLGYEITDDDFVVNRDGKLVASAEAWAGARELTQVVNLRWMKEFIRREESRSAPSRRWTT